MGSDPNERTHAYLQWLEAVIAPHDLQRLHAHASQERALGDERFQRTVETTLGRPAVCRPRGRPPRASLGKMLN
jgi:putative transposase